MSEFAVFVQDGKWCSKFWHGILCKEINREDISQDVLNYQNYPHGVYFRHDYQMECEAVEGDDLSIYLEATDSLGYLHRMLIHHWKEQNGAMAEAVDASEYIYAPDGTPVFP